MPVFTKKNVIRYPFYSLYSIALILVGIVTYHNWIIGMIGFILLLACLFLYMRMERMLSDGLKKVGEEALMEMPIVIMLFNDEYQIEWTNPFLASCLGEDTLVGRSLYDVAESIIPLVKQEVETEVVTLHDRK